jgi:hypothetical protein
MFGLKAFPASASAGHRHHAGDGRRPLRYVGTCFMPAVDSARYSNGKKKGEGNTKNGNAYLVWAFIEAANFARRFNEEARRFFDRKKSRTNSIVATKALAHKLARASYHVLKTKQPFDVKRCFV